MTNLKPFYERRRAEDPIGFSDRRAGRRRNRIKQVSAERRRLHFKFQRAQREPIKIPAVIHMEGEKKPVYTVDISRGGILIVCDQALTPGSTLLFEFSFGEDFCHVRVSGRVVYRRQIAEEPSINTIGIKFTEPADLAINFLVKVVTLLKETRYSEEKVLLTITQDFTR
jgi:hypothetical protein